MAQVNKKIQFVSLISRKDVPLYIQSFDIGPMDSENPENANKYLKYNFLSHMALDIFASPSSTSLREQQQDMEENGGAILLFIQDDITVYGYETNTGLKIIVGLGMSQASPEDKRDDDKSSPTPESKDSAKESTKESAKTPLSTKKPMKLKDLFSQLHKSYIHIICNPFTNLSGNLADNETILQSAKFDKSISKIVDSWNGI